MNTIKHQVKYKETSLREVTPKETLKRIEKAKLIGENRIVPKVFRVDAIDQFEVPVYLSFSKKVDGEGIDFKSAHAGKGITAEESKCSAVLEAIERFSAKMNGTEKLVLGTCNSIKDSIDISRFYPGENIEVDCNTVLEWVDVDVAGTGEKKYVPANYVYFPYRPILKKDIKILPHDTNGLAAGNSFKEALLHAIYEVIEKDALCIFGIIIAFIQM